MHKNGVQVKLISYTPNAERLCAAAAKGCYFPAPAYEIFDTLDETKAQKIIKNVIDRGHDSIIEHANYTFSISGVSRALTHQLVRHRIASYSQQSQRYVKYDTIDCVIPSSIQGNENIYQKFIDHIQKGNALYKEMINNNIEPEDARFIFPNAACTAITATMNARELLHFFQLRTCTKAQWEIRELANKMLEEVKKVSPTIFQKAGPTCMTQGVCFEKEPCKMEMRKNG